MSKIIVISSDAMVGEDLEYFKTLPNYKKYIAGGAEIKNVSSIYPSVTFPAHVTMMTGLYPDKHRGIFQYAVNTPGSDPTPLAVEIMNFYSWNRYIPCCKGCRQDDRCCAMACDSI